LTSLNLECNKLTHVPFGLDYLKSLKFLRLGRNMIESRGVGGTSYPELDAADAIAQLKKLANNLIVLELQQNRIDWFPEELCSLSRLIHLDLSANKIAAIPDQGKVFICRKCVLRTPTLWCPNALGCLLPVSH